MTCIGIFRALTVADFSVKSSKPSHLSSSASIHKKFISREDWLTLYRLNHAIVVKLYHPYTLFPRNVRLSHRGIATFSAHRDFWLLRLGVTLKAGLGVVKVTDQYIVYDLLLVRHCN